MSSTFLTAKDILLQYDLSKPIDEEGKIMRGTAFEFQDYAYRLAKDLNDLSHIHIYMRLAKTVPRFLLEKAFEFVADISQEEKAKLYMWKLKQVRSAYQRELDMNNFGHTFVMKKMKSLRKQMAQKIIEKNDLNNRFIGYAEHISNQYCPEQVLLLENSSKLLPTVLKAKKITGIDECTELTRKLKEHYTGITSLRFLTKSFLKNSFSASTFDLIIIPKIWTWLPFESEHDYLSEIHRLLRHNGIVLIGVKQSEKSNQQWKYLKDTSEDIFFEKATKINEFMDICGKMGFKKMHEIQVSDMTYILLKKI